MSRSPPALADDLSERLGAAAATGGGARRHAASGPASRACRRGATRPDGRLRRPSVSVERRGRAARGARALPDVRGLIVGGHEQRTGPGASAGACRDGWASPTRHVHRPGRSRPQVAARLREADVLVLPNPASAISTAFTSPLKLFEYMAAGRPIVASDLPSIREVLRRRERAAGRRRATPAALAAGISRACWPIRRSRHGSRRAARGRRRGLHLGAARRAARGAVHEVLAADDFPTAARARPLPGLPRHAGSRGGWRRSLLPVHAGGTYRAPPNDYPRPAARGSSTPSRRSIWTRRCTPTRGTSACRRRCSARRSATTCCARSCAPTPAIASSISAAAAAARCCGTRLAAPSRRHRHQPVLRRGSAAASVDLLLGDLRRLPFADGTFTKAYSLDVLEHLSPEALRGMLAEAAPRARARRRAVRLHARAEERADRRRAALDQRARAAARAARADRHAAGAAAQVGSPEPARRHPASSSAVARGAGFRIERIRYYTPIVGGFVENILMRMAERAMAKRAARARSRRQAAAEDSRCAQPSAKRAPRPRQRIASEPADLRGRCARCRRDEARPAAVRPDHVGPFFALLVKRADPLSGPMRDPATAPSTRPCPARSADRCTSRRWPKGCGARPRGPRARDAGTGRFRPGPVTVDAMPPPLGRKQLRWARTGAVARLARTLQPDVDHRALLQLRRRRRSSLPARRAASAVLEVNAPVDRLPRLDEGAARSRAARRADAPLARAHLRRAPT